MLNSAAISGVRYISDTLALIVCGSEDVPPTVCPDLVPAGWRLANDEVIDFNLADGDFLEVYVLERETE